jgi:hypothetical protein
MGARKDGLVRGRKGRSVMAAFAPLKTSQRRIAAEACEAFEHKPVGGTHHGVPADHSLRATGKRARGAQAIDVPRIPGSPVLPFPAEHPTQREGDRCVGTTCKEKA